MCIHVLDTSDQNSFTERLICKEVVIVHIRDADPPVPLHTSLCRTEAIEAHVRRLDFLQDKSQLVLLRIGIHVALVRIWHLLKWRRYRPYGDDPLSEIQILDFMVVGRLRHLS